MGVKKSRTERQHTSRNHSRLVLLIGDLFLLNVSSREKKSHHPFEELVHELDGERHHVHLTKQKQRESGCLNSTCGAPGVCRQTDPHLEVLLHRDPSHRGAHFAENTQSKLAPQLAVTLRTKHNLGKDDDVTEKV